MLPRQRSAPHVVVRIDAAETSVARAIEVASAMVGVFALPTRGVARALSGLGDTAVMRCDYVTAAPLLKESLVIFRRLGC